MPKAKPKAKASVAFGYARVSTSRQEMSIEVQRDQVHKYYQWKLGHDDVAWGECYVDPATSGSLPFKERTAGFALCNRAGPGDHIIVAKLDRAFRNARDAMNCLHTWMERGVRVHILDIGADSTTPFGRMMIQMMAIFAEWERSRMIERLKDVNALRRGRGEPYPGGHDPLGFFLRKPKGKPPYLDENKEELLTMKRVYEMHLNGEASARISEKFNTLGVKRLRRNSGTNRRPDNKPWSVTVICCYLRSYKKLLAQNKLPEYARPGASASKPTDATTPSAATPSPPTGTCSSSTSPTPAAPPP